MKQTKKWYKVVFHRWLPNGEDTYFDIKAMKEWLNKNVQEKPTLYFYGDDDKWRFNDLGPDSMFYFTSKEDQVQFKLVFC